MNRRVTRAWGRWNHTGSFSTWSSAETWRPLPRREWSARSDYQVLLGTNRHTITATGWLQEENNLKMVLDKEGSPDRAQPYRAREYGVARYSRMLGGDFQAADEYYQRTRSFWTGVLTSWHELFLAHSVVALRAPVDQAGLFRKLFEYADQLAGGQTRDSPPLRSSTTRWQTWGRPSRNDLPSDDAGSGARYSSVAPT